MNDSALAQEWRLLQNQFDSYEKYSLLIKLLSISLTAGSALMTLTSQSQIALLILLVILWLQDGIWKTFQARIEQRLLTLEQALLAKQLAEQQTQSTQVNAYQFNRAFLNNRKGGLALIMEYLKQCLRPTIAYPYIFLISLVVASLCANT